MVIDPVALTLPENITVDKWFQPLSEPGPPISRHAALATSGETHANEILPAPGVETITLDKWLQPLAEPVRDPRRARPTLVVLSFGVPLPPFDWLVPLSEPVLPPLPRPIPAQAEPPSFFEPEVTSLNKWFQPFAEPVPAVVTYAHLRAGPFDDVNIWPPQEVVTLDKWYVPLSLPTPPVVTFAHLMAGAFDANETLPTPAAPTVFDANLRLGYHEVAGIAGQPSLGGR
jgi:hypothetical protein